MDDKIKKQDSKIDNIDNLSEFDMGAADQYLDDGSNLDDLFVDNDKSSGERKPITDFVAGLSEAVKSVNLKHPDIEGSISDAFPNTSSLFSAAIDTMSDVERMRVDVIKELGPSVNQLKQATRRVLPKIKGIVPDSIYEKMYNKLAPTPVEDVPAEVKAEDVRAQNITQQLTAIFEAQNAQNNEDRLADKTSDYISLAISRSEHKDTTGLLSSIRSHLLFQNNFSQTVLKGYLMKSLELKYRHLYVSQDLLATAKLTFETIDNRLKSITQNTALPDVQKKKNIEFIKEQQMETLIGKGLQSIGNWTSDYRNQIMTNIRNLVKDKVGMAKDAIGDIAQMIESQAGIDELSADMGFEPDSRAKSAGKTLGEILMTKLGRKAVQHGTKLAGQYGTDLETIMGNFQQDLKFKINDRIMNLPEDSPLRVFLQGIVPTFRAERGGVQKLLKKNAFEEIPWDVLSRRTLVEVIPGYLSKQLQQLMNLVSGRTDSEEIVYDHDREDFKTVSDYKERMERKVFGDKATRTNEVAQGVGRLLGAFTMHGGPEAEFYESMDDIVKFLNNSAKHGKLVNPKTIAKLAAGEEISDKDYEEYAFKDVANKDALIKVLNQVFHAKDGRANIDVHGEANAHLIQMAKERDDRLIRELQLTAGFGTSRHFNQYLQEDGTLRHEAVREKYRDLDEDVLRVVAQEQAQIAKHKYVRADKFRFLKESELEDAEINVDKESPVYKEYQAYRAARKAGVVDKRLWWQKAIGRREVSFQDFINLKKKYQDRKNIEEIKGVSENIFSKLADKLNTIADRLDPNANAKEAIKEQLTKEINDLKEKTGQDLSDKLIKDTPHISGPGVYVQGSEKEMHIPMDNDKYWKQLTTAFSKGVDLSEFAIARKTDYEKILDDISAMRQVLEDTLPNITLGILPNELLEKLKGTSIFKRITGAGSSIFSYAASKSKQMSNMWLNFAENLMGGTGKLMGGAMRMGGSILSGGAAGLGKIIRGTGELYGGALGAVGRKFGGIGIPKFSISDSLKGIDIADLFSFGSTDPVITAEQLKRGVRDRTGKIITKLKDLKNPPFYDPDTGKVLVSVSTFLKGLGTRDGVPLINLSEFNEKRKGILRKAGGMIARGTGKAASITSDLFAKGAGILPDMYKKLFDLGISGVRGAGKIFGRFFGLDGGTRIGRKTIEELVTSRLDKIYQLLDERLVRKITGDIDNDGDREGSYQDYVQKQEEHKADLQVGKSFGIPGRFARAQMRTLQLLGLGGAGSATNAATEETPEEDKEEGGGIVDTALGVAGASALGAVGTKLKGKVGKFFGKKAGKAAAKEATELAAKKAGSKGLLKLLTKIPKVGKIVGIGGAALAGGKALMDRFGGWFGKKATEEGVEAGAKTVGKEAAEEIAKKTSTVAAEKAGAKLAGEEVAKVVAKQSLLKGAAKLGGKGLAKLGAKALPGIGLLMGVGFGAKRMMQGDWTGAAMEVASGAASTFLPPGIGLAATAAIEGAIIAKDLRDFSKSPSGEIRKARFKAYGFNDDRYADAIEELERVMTRLLRTSVPIDMHALQVLSKEFGLDPADKEQVAYFKTWLTNRFVPVITIFTGLMKTKYDIDRIEEVSRIPEDDADNFIKDFNENIKLEVKCDDALVPTKMAYKRKISETKTTKSLWDKLFGKSEEKEDKKTDSASIDRAAKEAAGVGGIKGTTTANSNKTFGSRIINLFSSEAEAAEYNVDNNRPSETQGISGRPKSKVVAKITPNTEGMLTGQLGILSEQYESSGSSEAIGYDSTGGTSYGKYQIASRRRMNGSSTFDEFIDWVETQPGGFEVAERLRAAGQANTGGKGGSVPNEWKKLIQEGKMGEFEHAFIKETHYDPAYNGITNREFKKRIDSSKPLRDVLWSTAVQHGGSRASEIFNQAWNENLSNADIVKRIYENRSGRFRSSTADVRQSVWNRFDHEEAQVVAMLKRDEQLKQMVATSTIQPIGITPEISTPNIPKSTQTATTVASVDTATAGKSASAISVNYNEPQVARQIVQEEIHSPVAENTSTVGTTSGVTVTTEPDVKQHELLQAQNENLDKVAQGITDLNVVMRAALGDDGIFKEMNKGMQTLAKKDSIVNINTTNANTSIGSQQPQSTFRKSGINVSKQRVG